MDDKKLKTLRKCFKGTNEEHVMNKRLQEIDVVLSELGSLKPHAEVFCGSENSVLFASDCTSIKADLKKERSNLKKNLPSESNALSF